ncbi:MAG: ATP-binding cassette domain-containing protein, partial [SAR324 cluster bacterium]|nr:ATP-binding cassette domain-containing protein [SAR324 cluster bacterium]
MTVDENLQLGGWTFRKDKQQVREKIEANYERFPVLREKRKHITGELSGGQQRMVEISRTLMAEPKVLLVDEPTAGLSKMLSEEVYEMLKMLVTVDELTILLVDQEIRQALKIADYVYVLELGRNKFEGPAQQFTDLEKAFWVGG